ncbi:MAG: hypothetical protein ACRDDY_16110 [Clostridium sp.]|uniref:hypothetical protein n=1 Tax=Clostridium sp. TaxID=1506 RepID=UPI003EE5BA7F
MEILKEYNPVKTKEKEEISIYKKVLIGGAVVMPVMIPALKILENKMMLNIPIIANNSLDHLIKVFKLESFINCGIEKEFIGGMIILFGGYAVLNTVVEILAIRLKGIYEEC